ncbi:hypothetical protein CcI49_23110 [Frankia sp. CcI49]|nr:hypothetical protein CcI49_23110 [Frankia sp. CcI49]
MGLARDRVTTVTEYAAWDGQADSPAHAQDLAEHAPLAWAPGEPEVVEVGPVGVVGIGVMTEPSEA